MKIIFLCVITVFAMQENHRKLLVDQISKPADQFVINSFRTLFSTLHKIYDGKEIAQEVSEVILENLYQNTDLSKTKVTLTHRMIYLLTVIVHFGDPLLTSPRQQSFLLSDYLVDVCFPKIMWLCFTPLQIILTI